MADMFGTNGNDVIEGTPDADFIVGGPSDQEPALETGSDTINGQGGGDTIIGIGGNDTLDGGAGEDWISGGAGDDTINGGLGTNDDENFIWDAVDYQEDVAEGGFQGVIVDLGTGVAIDPFGNTDTLIDIERVYGTNFADTIIGSDGDDAFDPHGGSDLIEGGVGFDALMYHHSYRFGGMGGIVVTFDETTAAEGDGIVIDPYGQIDRFTGIEAIRGTPFEDRVVAGEGFQQLRGLEGDDTLDGGADFDVVAYDLDSRYGGTQGISADLSIVDAEGYSTVTDGFGSHDRIRNVEMIHGTEFADTINGGNADEVLEGVAGNDVLEGRGGDDYLDGMLGADLLTGGAGNDTIIGSDGIDTAVYSGTRAAYLVSLNEDGSFTIADQRSGTPDGTDTVSTTDIFRFADGDRTAAQLAAANVIEGTPGDDTLSGTQASDIINAHAGEDWMSGGAGDDTIDGGSGTDDDANFLSRDTVDYQADVERGGGHGATVNLATGTAIDPFGHTDTLIDIERVFGTNFADLIIGAGENEVFDPNGGDDFVDGGDGFDQLLYHLAGGTQGIVVTFDDFYSEHW